MLVIIEHIRRNIQEQRDAGDPAASILFSDLEDFLSELERLRAALEEIKGKYAWQTEAGAIARKALTPDKDK
jgi:hypothetical protein